MQSKWYGVNSIKNVHREIEVRQIYMWLTTEDKKVAVVSKDKENWQFPGGKPKLDENRLETMRRELLEETGLRMSKLKTTPMFFGYYFIQKEGEEFLQLRYLLLADLNSKKLDLKPQENPIDPDPIIEAKFIELSKLPEVIPWTEGLAEYEWILANV